LDVSGSDAAEKQATAAIGGTFLVTNTTRQPTGTGVLNPFVRIQQKGDEHGYNTSAGTPLDEKAGIWTHDLRFSEVQAAVNIGGVAYREFILDVNQSHNGPLSLNQIQIFQSTSPPGLTGIVSDADDTGGGHNALISFGSGVTEVFRMNNRDVTASNLEIWAHTDSGSGSGDMYLYVRDDLFTQDPNSYITLYSQFGSPNGTYDSSAGFEEWAVDPPLADVPGPPTLLLTAAGLPALALRRFVRRKKAEA
jgi:hypothetical protein